jgi:hypothetical protein
MLMNLIEQLQKVCRKIESTECGSRIRPALHVLRGRPLAYRMKLQPLVFANGEHRDVLIQECHIESSTLDQAYPVWVRAVHQPSNLARCLKSVDFLNRA